MDLMKTLLVYMSLVFSASVMTAPQPSFVPPAAIPPTPTAVVATKAPTPAPTLKPTPKPEPTMTPSPEYKSLSVGSRGEAVKKLQRRLAELGYLTGTVDGAYGNQTRRAVERFQYYNGLTVDGVAGPRTQTILYESHEVVFAPVDVTPTPSPRPTRTPRPTPTATAEPTPSPRPTRRPTPTPEATEEPTPSPRPTRRFTPTPEATEEPSPSPTPTQTPEPTAEPTPAPMPVDGSQILVNGAAEALVDENGRAVRLYRRMEGEALVPFTTLARLLGWVTTPDEDDVYDVAANEYALHVAYVRDESGQVVRVDIQVDGLPVELMPEQALVTGEELLLTPAALEILLNAQWSFDQDLMIVTIAFPPKNEPPTQEPPEEEPTPESAEPTPQIAPTPMPIEGSKILMDEAADALVDENGRIVELYRRTEGEVLAPFNTVARLLGFVTTPDEGNPDGYTVAANGYMLHVAYSRDELGQVTKVDFQVDGLPVEIAPELTAMSGEELLLTPAAVQALLNAQWSYSEMEPVLILLFPPKDADDSITVG